MSAAGAIGGRLMRGLADLVSGGVAELRSNARARAGLAVIALVISLHV